MRKTNEPEEWVILSKDIIYNKGENRRRHNGKKSHPEVVLEHGVWIGKCPKGFNIDAAQSILKTAIPEYRRTLPDKPCRLWAYFDGAVYAARTEDGGKTWHGYPSKDRPPIDILEKLHKMHTNDRDSIEKWFRKKWKS